MANAGLIAPATVAQHLGLRDLFDALVELDDASGRANIGLKVMSLIRSALACGDRIDVADSLPVPHPWIGISVGQQAGARRAP